MHGYAHQCLSIQAAGVAKTAPRHEWPVAVLQQVVGDLMREAPRQLLARELWAGSGSAAGWWRRQQLFAASTAVMSMVTGFNGQLPCIPAALLSTTYRHLA